MFVIIKESVEVIMFNQYKKKINNKRMKNKKKLRELPPPF